MVTCSLRNRLETTCELKFLFNFSQYYLQNSLHNCKNRKKIACMSKRLHDASLGIELETYWWLFIYVRQTLSSKCFRNPALFNFSINYCKMRKICCHYYLMPLDNPKWTLQCLPRSHVNLSRLINFISMIDKFKIFCN